MSQDNVKNLIRDDSEDEIISGLTQARERPDNPYWISKRHILLNPETVEREIALKREIEVYGIRARIELSAEEGDRAMKFKSIETFSRILESKLKGIMKMFGHDEKSRKDGFLNYLSKTSKLANGQRREGEIKISSDFQAFVRVQTKALLEKGYQPAEELEAKEENFFEMYEIWVRELGLEPLTKREFEEKGKRKNSPLERLQHIQKNEFKPGSYVIYKDVPDSRSYKIIGLSEDCLILLEGQKKFIDPMNCMPFKKKSLSFAEKEDEAQIPIVNISSIPKKQKTNGPEKKTSEAPEKKKSEDYQAYCNWAHEMGLISVVTENRFNKEDPEIGTMANRFKIIKAKEFKAGDLVRNAQGRVNKIKKVSLNCTLIFEGVGSKREHPKDYEKVV